MANDEEVDVVDNEDHVVGVATIERCLREGLLHRAIAVLVKRNNGAVVLQQRSRNDSWHPGKWTISCTGHVRRGESYQQAAIRELGEELGLKSKVEEFRKFLLPPISSDGLTELEWITLFTTFTDAPLTIDPVELESALEVRQSRLRKIITDWPLAPDAKIILGEYMESSALSK
ncbi:MAG TPA: NUDIX domain-containing protein [Nitrososphaerales archaeon]